ncbi:DegT/DnrJ/EryC1/StrS family aminotransferase [Patescibacteria group bacterium]|nr:DegT/DnrJ/EryC1/StrS family aminotransferase [Patescibacteria group bacterium]
MIKLTKSTFLNEQETRKKLAQFISQANFLSMGRECLKFEKSFAKKQKRRYAAMVSNGSMANLILIQALLNLGKLKKGDRIGVSALTWATNVMPVIQLGLKPVALDCELETLNISANILKKIRKKIKALFLTNVLGFSDQINQVKRWCGERGVMLLEDNCESLGSRMNGKLLGNFGIASTFSFFVGHHLSTIEGGMICTNNAELHQMICLTRAHGWDRNLTRFQQKAIRRKNKIVPFFARYTFYDLAFNARPTEINGFIGNLQIKYWDEIVKKRENNFRIFQKIIQANPDLLELKVDHLEKISNFAMPVVCKNKKLFQKYKKKFEVNNVEIRPVIAGNITRQPFYRKYLKNTQPCKNVDFIHTNGFYFPNNPELTRQEIGLLSRLISRQ